MLPKNQSDYFNALGNSRYRIPCSFILSPQYHHDSTLIIQDNPWVTACQTAAYNLYNIILSSCLKKLPTSAPSPFSSITTVPALLSAIVEPLLQAYPLSHPARQKYPNYISILSYIALQTEHYHIVKVFAQYYAIFLPLDAIYDLVYNVDLCGDYMHRATSAQSNTTTYPTETTSQWDSLCHKFGSSLTSPPMTPCTPICSTNMPIYTFSFKSLFVQTHISSILAFFLTYLACHYLAQNLMIQQTQTPVSPPISNHPGHVLGGSTPVTTATISKTPAPNPNRFFKRPTPTPLAPPIIDIPPPSLTENPTPNTGTRPPFHLPDRSYQGLYAPPLTIILLDIVIFWAINYPNTRHLSDLYGFPSLPNQFLIKAHYIPPQLLHSIQFPMVSGEKKRLTMTHFAYEYEHIQPFYEGLHLFEGRLVDVFKSHLAPYHHSIIAFHQSQLLSPPPTGNDNDIENISNDFDDVDGNIYLDVTKPLVNLDYHRFYVPAANVFFLCASHLRGMPIYLMTVKFIYFAIFAKFLQEKHGQIPQITQNSSLFSSPQDYYNQQLLYYFNTLLNIQNNIEFDISTTKFQQSLLPRKNNLLSSLLLLSKEIPFFPTSVDPIASLLIPISRSFDPKYSSPIFSTYRRLLASIDKRYIIPISLSTVHPLLSLFPPLEKDVYDAMINISGKQPFLLSHQFYDSLASFFLGAVEVVPCFISPDLLTIENFNNKDDTNNNVIFSHILSHCYLNYHYPQTKTMNPPLWLVLSSTLQKINHTILHHPSSHGVTPQAMHRMLHYLRIISPHQLYPTDHITKEFVSDHVTFNFTYQVARDFCTNMGILVVSEGTFLPQFDNKPTTAIDTTCKTTRLAYTTLRAYHYFNLLTPYYSHAVPTLPQKPRYGSDFSLEDRQTYLPTPFTHYHLPYNQYTLLLLQFLSLTYWSLSSPTIPSLTYTSSPSTYPFIPSSLSFEKDEYSRVIFQRYLMLHYQPPHNRPIMGHIISQPIASPNTTLPLPLLLFLITITSIGTSLYDTSNNAHRYTIVANHRRRRMLDEALRNRDSTPSDAFGNSTNGEVAALINDNNVINSREHKEAYFKRGSHYHDIHHKEQYALISAQIAVLKFLMRVLKAHVTETSVVHTIMAPFTTTQIFPSLLNTAQYGVFSELVHSISSPAFIQPLCSTPTNITPLSVEPSHYNIIPIKLLDLWDLMEQLRFNTSHSHNRFDSILTSTCCLFIPANGHFNEQEIFPISFNPLQTYNNQFDFPITPTLRKTTNLRASTIGKTIILSTTPAPPTPTVFGQNAYPIFNFTPYHCSLLQLYIHTGLMNLFVSTYYNTLLEDTATIELSQFTNHELFRIEGAPNKVHTIIQCFEESYAFNIHFSDPSLPNPCLSVPQLDSNAIFSQNSYLSGFELHPFLLSRRTVDNTFDEFLYQWQYHWVTHHLLFSPHNYIYDPSSLFSTMVSDKLLAKMAHLLYLSPPTQYIPSTPLITEPLTRQFGGIVSKMAKDKNFTPQITASLTPTIYDIIVSARSHFTAWAIMLSTTTIMFQNAALFKFVFYDYLHTLTHLDHLIHQFTSITENNNSSLCDDLNSPSSTTAIFINQLTHTPSNISILQSSTHFLSQLAQNRTIMGTIKAMLLGAILLPQRLPNTFAMSLPHALFKFAEATFTKKIPFMIEFNKTMRQMKLSHDNPNDGLDGVDLSNSPFPQLSQQNHGSSPDIQHVLAYASSYLFGCPLSSSKNDNNESDDDKIETYANDSMENLTISSIQSQCVLLNQNPTTQLNRFEFFCLWLIFGPLCIKEIIMIWQTTLSPHYNHDDVHNELQLLVSKPLYNFLCENNLVEFSHSFVHFLTSPTSKSFIQLHYPTYKSQCVHTNPSKLLRPLLIYLNETLINNCQTALFTANVDIPQTTPGFEDIFPTASFFQQIPSIALTLHQIDASITSFGHCHQHRKSSEISTQKNLIDRPEEPFDCETDLAHVQPVGLLYFYLDSIPSPSIDDVQLLVNGLSLDDQQITSPYTLYLNMASPSLHIREHDEQDNHNILVYPSEMLFVEFVPPSRLLPLTPTEQNPLIIRAIPSHPTTIILESFLLGLFRAIHPNILSLLLNLIDSHALASYTLGVSHIFYNSGQYQRTFKYHADVNVLHLIEMSGLIYRLDGRDIMTKVNDILMSNEHDV